MPTPMTTWHPWIDYGNGAEEIEACRYHPNHAWIVQRVCDMTTNCSDPDELLTVCKGCLAVRCGYVTDPNPCMEPRHHRCDHRLLDGTTYPIGGSPQ